MIRVGVAGYGKIGQLRAKILSERTDLEIVGIYDPQKSDSNDDQLFCDSYDELINSGLDAVFICAYNTVLAEYTTKALNYLLENKIKEVFNVGTGNGLSVLDIINTFEKVNKLKVNYNFGPRRLGDIQEIYSDGDKIMNVLGWKANKTINEALISAWNWQKSRK